MAETTHLLGLLQKHKLNQKHLADVEIINPANDEVLTYEGSTQKWKNKTAPGGVDEKVKVSSDDTTTDFLLQKLLAGTGITLSQNNPAGNEKVKIDAHRKWGWADEQGWHREIFVPLAYEKSWVDKGTVLTTGGSGAWDETRCTLPCVVLKSKTEWYLYYSGRSAAGAWRVGLATSSDGVNFSKYGTDGKILDPPGGYSNINNLQVIYDDLETQAYKKWKAIAQTDDHLYYFYSGDGITWTAISRKDNLLTAFKQSAVWFRLGNAYFVMYEDTATPNNIRLAVFKPDMLAAYNYGIILSCGAAGEWDDDRITEIGLFWNLGVWYLTYMGKRNTAGADPCRIGMATTGSNPFRTWDKWDINPVVEGPTGGDWQGVTLGNLIMLEDEFRMYCGYNDGTSGFDKIRRYGLV